MTLNRRIARRLGAWFGLLALPACVLAATPAAAQVALSFDPDATEQKLRGLTAQFQERGFEGSSRLARAGRTDGPARLSPEQLALRPGFFKGHLFPRMTSQVAAVPPMFELETQHGRFENSSIHGWLSDRVRMRARRAARKAAKAYGMEETPLGRWVDSLAVSAEGFGRPTIATSTSFRLNVAHGIPSAGMKHRGLGGTTRFSVGFDGTVRLDFNPARFVSAHFYAAYEAEDDRYRLTYRHAF